MAILRFPSDLELSFMRYTDFIPTQKPNDALFSYSQTIIETNKSTFEIAYILINYLKHLNALIIKINQSKFTIKAEVFINYIKYYIKIRIYSKSNNNKHVIEFNRFSGDSIVFNKIYNGAIKIFINNIDISKINLSIFEYQLKNDYNLDFYDDFLNNFIFSLANEIDSSFDSKLYKNDKIIKKLKLCLKSDIEIEILFPAVNVLLKFCQDKDIRDIILQNDFMPFINKHLENIYIYPYIKDKLNEIKKLIL